MCPIGGIRKGQCALLVASERGNVPYWLHYKGAVCPMGGIRKGQCAPLVALEMCNVPYW
jgi:hypothetical protein